MTTPSSSTPGGDGRIYGCVIGLVEEVDDPERQGRIKVTYPWLDGQTISNWASIAAPMAGNGRGLQAFPEISDEVVLSFDRGRMDHPIVMGFTWNGQDAPPDFDRRVKVWRTGQGNQVLMADSTPNGGSLGVMMMGDAHGNMVTMSAGVVTVMSMGALRLKAPAVVIEVAGVERVVLPSPKPI